MPGGNKKVTQMVYQDTWYGFKYAFAYSFLL